MPIWATFFPAMVIILFTDARRVELFECSFV